MSDLRIPDYQKPSQEGESPDSGGASLSCFKGGVPLEERRGNQREWSEGGPQAKPERAVGEGGEAPGLDTYKTSDPFLLILPEEARLKRMRHGVITSARLMEEQRQELQKGGFRYKAVFLGATYRPGEPWTAKDVTSMLKAARKWLERRGVRLVYTWVAEIQEQRAAGAPLDENCLHYHVMIWLPIGLTLPKPDKQGWWSHGSTSREWARNPVGYLAKYASKGGCLERVPKGARLSGFGGLTRKRRQERAWWMSPVWIREKWSVEDRPCRIAGGGWVSRLTGEVIESPWRFLGVFYAGEYPIVRLIKKRLDKVEIAG